ncbi:hypothetical protein Tco_1533075 [Tanacetum coccineum]
MDIGEETRTVETIMKSSACLWVECNEFRTSLAIDSLCYKVNAILHTNENGPELFVDIRARVYQCWVSKGVQVEEGEDEGRMMRMAKRLLRSLTLAFGYIAFAYLVEWILDSYIDKIPIYIQQHQKGQGSQEARHEEDIWTKVAKYSDEKSLVMVSASTSKWFYRRNENHVETSNLYRKSIEIVRF